MGISLIALLEKETKRTDNEVSVAVDRTSLELEHANAQTAIKRHTALLSLTFAVMKTPTRNFQGPPESIHDSINLYD